MAEWSDKDQARLQRICKAGHIILIIAMVITAVFFILTLAASVLSLFDSETTTSDSLEMFIGAVALLMMVAVLFFLNKMVGGISAGESPFTSENSDTLRLISILFFVAFLMLTIASIVVAILDNDASKWSFEWTPLITAVVLYVMSLVFRYGTELQIQSDETV